jgi:hypothetical protein
MSKFKLTPGKDSVVHNMHGTIYEKVVAAPYTYHMHAAVTDQALLAKPVWTIWREHDDGQIVPPVVDDAPHPDGNIATDPTVLVYWATT